MSNKNGLSAILYMKLGFLSAESFMVLIINDLVRFKDLYEIMLKLWTTKNIYHQQCFWFLPTISHLLELLGLDNGYTTTTTE